MTTGEETTTIDWKVVKDLSLASIDPSLPFFPRVGGKTVVVVSAAMAGGARLLVFQLL